MTCTICNQLLHNSKYYMNKDGYVYTGSICKECHNAKKVIQQKKPPRKQIPEYIQCNYCNELLHKDKYVIYNNRLHEGRCCRCCRNKNRKTYYSSHPDRYKEKEYIEYKKKYYQLNKEERCKKQKEWAHIITENGIPIDREKYIWRVYKLTGKEYANLLIIQEDSCAICKSVFDTKAFTKKAVHVDHCHTTGKVRGLLCNNCNAGIGYMKENISTLQSAIEYLKCHKI